MMNSSILVSELWSDKHDKYVLIYDGGNHFYSHFVDLDSDSSCKVVVYPDAYKLQEVQDEAEDWLNV